MRKSGRSSRYVSIVYDVLAASQGNAFLYVEKEKRTCTLTTASFLAALLLYCSTLFASCTQDVTNKDHVLVNRSKDKGLKKLSGHNSHSQIAEVAHPMASVLPKSNHLLPSSILVKPEKQSKMPVDIYQFDHCDPLAATSYVHDIYHMLREKEVSTPSSPTYISPSYMNSQSQLSENMRAVLVDWLVEVQHKFGLSNETLYLTVNVVDRFLTNDHVTRKRFQLAGVTALWIASKYEDIYCPTLDELVYICAHSYSKEEIIETEVFILKSLNYQMTVPTADKFLSRYLKAASADTTMTNMAKYILESTLFSYDLLKYRPSQLAAAAVMIAIKEASVGRFDWSNSYWTNILSHYSGYESRDIVPVADAILAERAKIPSKFMALTKKYSHDRFGQVANFNFLYSILSATTKKEAIYF